jgi:hypothetical protein
MDVMLKLSDFVVASHADRRRMLADALKSDIPRTIEKRKFRQFDLAKFKSELEAAIEQQLLGPDASRFDLLVLERATGF